MGEEDAKALGLDSEDEEVPKRLEEESETAIGYEEIDDEKKQSK
jgi:hypothetical protein